MPAVDSARRAAKFCASPMAAMTPASSVAEDAPRIWWLMRTLGLVSKEAPRVPTFMGISISPTKSPAALLRHRDSAL